MISLWAKQHQTGGSWSHGALVEGVPCTVKGLALSHRVRLSKRGVFADITASRVCYYLCEVWQSVMETSAGAPVVRVGRKKVPMGKTAGLGVFFTKIEFNSSDFLFFWSVIMKIHIGCWSLLTLNWFTLCYLRFMTHSNITTVIKFELLY